MRSKRLHQNIGLLFIDYVPSFPLLKRHALFPLSFGLAMPATSSFHSAEMGGRGTRKEILREYPREYSANLHLQEEVELEQIKRCGFCTQSSFELLFSRYRIEPRRDHMGQLFLWLIWQRAKDIWPEALRAYGKNYEQEHNILLHWRVLCSRTLC